MSTSGAHTNLARPPDLQVAPNEKDGSCAWWASTEFTEFLEQRDTTWMDTSKETNDDFVENPGCRYNV